MFKRHQLIKIVSLISILLFTPALFATPIPIGLNIGGSLSSTTADAFGTNSSTGASWVGGVLTAGTDLSVLDSEVAAFTDTGDGFKLLSTVTGNHTDGVSYDGFSGNASVIELAMLMDNSTASDYRITLDLDFSIFALVTGADAFIESLFSFNDSVTTLISRDVTSDNVFGDLVNMADTGTFGDPQAIAGATSFVFDIAAGTSSQLNGLGGLRAGAYDGTFTGDFDFDLKIASIEDITQTTPPQAVPEPAVINLFAFALFLLLIRKRYNQ